MVDAGRAVANAEEENLHQYTVFDTSMSGSQVPCRLPIRTVTTVGLIPGQCEILNFNSRSAGYDLDLDEKILLKKSCLLYLYKFCHLVRRIRDVAKRSCNVVLTVLTYGCHLVRMEWLGSWPESLNLADIIFYV